MSQHNQKIEIATFHINYDCTHKCSFCYLGQETERVQEKSDEKILVDIVHALANAAVNEVCLVGGDPALSPYIMPIVKACYNRDITASILSNTHKYRGVSVAQVAKFVSSFETTFHGSTAKEHDRITGEVGSYSSVLDQLRKAHKYCLSLGAVINIMPKKKGHIFQTVQSLCVEEKLPLNTVMIQRIMPFGSARKGGLYKLSKEDTQSALDEADQIESQLGLSVIFEDPLPFVDDCQSKHVSPKACDWGLTKANVDMHGNVSCCGANPTHTIGNLLETPLNELWSDKECHHVQTMRVCPRVCETCPETNGLS